MAFRSHPSYYGHPQSAFSGMIEGNESAPGIIQKIYRGPQQGNEMDARPLLSLCIGRTLRGNGPSLHFSSLLSVSLKKQNKREKLEDWHGTTWVVFVPAIFCLFFCISHLQWETYDRLSSLHTCHSVCQLGTELWRTTPVEMEGGGWRHLAPKRPTIQFILKA